MFAEDIATTLRANGYSCRLSAHDSAMLLFEDDAIFGFVVLFETASQLLEGWKDTQLRFIKGSAGSLRRSNMKSWNCYAIFLASGAAQAGLQAALTDIEEDLTLTRKIVADGVSTARDIERALLPILPIQKRSVAASPEKVNLADRLEAWSSSSLRALEGDAGPEELLDILWDNL